MNNKFLPLVIIIAAITCSCTTMGKPIEECFVPKDNIRSHNFIGIVGNRLPGWEYRLCKSDTVGDICVDGTMKNAFNTTHVDIVVDQVHFTGKMEYKTQSMLTNDLYITLQGDKPFVVSETFRGDDWTEPTDDAAVSAHISMNGQDERWEMTLLGKRVIGRNTVKRTEAEYTFDIEGKKYSLTVSDILKGKVINGDFNGRHFYGRTLNELVVIKYLFNGDDLSEEDMLFFTVVDIVRLLRSSENKRR